MQLIAATQEPLPILVDDQLEMPPVLPTTLGYAAVRSQRLLTRDSRFAEQDDPSARPEVHESDLRADLLAVRQALTHAQPHVREPFDVIMRDFEIETRRRPTADQTPAFDHYAKRAGDGGVDNETLFEFLEWQLNDIAAQQEVISPTVESLRGSYIAALEKGVSVGQFHPRGTSQAVSAAQTLKVFVGDPTHMYTPGEEGYHYEATGEVVIIQGSGVTIEEREANLELRVRKIMGHEFNHFAFGHGLTRMEKEAGVEDIASCIKRGDYPDVIDPDKTGDVDGYYWDRKVIHVLNTVGSDFIPAKLNRLAWTSGGSSTPESEELHRRRDESWAVESVTEKVANYVDNRLYRIMSNDSHANVKEARARIMSEAVGLLQTNPAEIFGDQHEKPRSRMLGATALSKLVSRITSWRQSS